MILKINSLKAAIISFFFLSVTVLLLPVNNAIAPGYYRYFKKNIAGSA